jgi:hypothetical protein
VIATSVCRFDLCFGLRRFSWLVEINRNIDEAETESTSEMPDRQFRFLVQLRKMLPTVLRVEEFVRCLPNAGGSLGGRRGLEDWD